MSNHTPGPWMMWKTRFGTMNISPESPEHDNEGLVIATAYYRPSKREASEANARLIAAAPDLLAVALCEEEIDRPLCDIEEEGFPVLSRYGFALGPVGSGGSAIYEQVLRFVADLRRAAIAKAEPTP